MPHIFHAASYSDINRVVVHHSLSLVVHHSHSHISRNRIHLGQPPHQQHFSFSFALSSSKFTTMSTIGSKDGRRRLVDPSASPSPAPQRNQTADTRGAQGATGNVAITTPDPNDEEAIRENRELVRLQGFRTNVTGATLANLAKIAKEAPETLQNQPVVAFEPFYFFFYGSLQDPNTLRLVCKLRSTPILAPASIKDWRIMVWGPFPALVPQRENEDIEVKGMYWKCEKPQHVVDLAYYESDNYRLQHCKITTEDGQVLENGRTFVFDGDESDLEEAKWSLEKYLSRKNNFGMFWQQ
ncbi:hypothetical protein F5B20DRAFT_532748 [Whalleya microplaca]|nr:hypothetical protein F5B20DRAFT_532748 [Whalleya microplaca]